jgi:molecular chaperone DnaK (HSP70)
VVDLVIRTGGSSNVPAFVETLTELFGADRVQARHSFDSVAHGLGSQAQLLWAS